MQRAVIPGQMTAPRGTFNSPHGISRKNRDSVESLHSVAGYVSLLNIAFPFHPQTQ
jgi:exosome complex RNA-binding protein Rrp4